MASSDTSRWPQVLLAVYSIALFTATHWPKLPGVDVPGKDKTLHVVAYAILAGLLLNVLVRQDRFRRGMGAVIATAAIAATAAALDEWTQPYVGRACDLFDWLADVAGAVGVCTAYVLTRALGQQRAQP